jgi:hypothetical protein
MNFSLLFKVRIDYGVHYSVDTGVRFWLWSGQGAMLTTHVPLAPMFRTSRALPLLPMYFMGFEFIFAEKAQQVSLQNQFLWIASQENSTY